MQQQPAYGIGGAAAILDHFSEIGIALLGDILGEGIQQIVEELDRQAVLVNDPGQFPEQGFPRLLPPLDLSQFGPEAVQ